MPTRLHAANVRRRRFAPPPTRAHPLGCIGLSDRASSRPAVRDASRNSRRRRAHWSATSHAQTTKTSAFFLVRLIRERPPKRSRNQQPTGLGCERASDAAELARKSNLILSLILIRVRARARARTLMPARAANPFSSLEQPTGGPSEHAQDCAPETTSIEQCERQGRHRQRLILISLEPFLLRFHSPVRSFFR